MSEEKITPEEKPSPEEKRVYVQIGKVVVAEGGVAVLAFFVTVVASLAALFTFLARL